MPRLPSRRALLGAVGGGVLAAAGTGAYAFEVEPHWLEVVHHDLPVRHLPAALEGRRLVHLTDIQVGPDVDDDWVTRVFGVVRTLEPDLVTLTGDLTAYSPTVVDQARRVYAGLPHGRLATLAVLGNHDYGHAWHDDDHAQRVVDALSPLGIRVLRNERVDVRGLAVLGLDDLWADRFEPARAVRGLRPAVPAIALTHNPDTMDLPGWGAFRGWALAGHTHGGQVKPPFLEPPQLPVRNRLYAAGAHPTPGGRHVYVGRGVGHASLRARLNCRPEVTVHRLTRAG